ncbi:PREDICTED: uncharacterized protein LOC109382941 isoform X2 [Hipposideros armiger]|uniref:Uncharacterized protein LOC109382941 isoform X2 n=1 Tax=Hipposideros armiger TaxID=186990 RepID=A0A8B7RDU4_HIPAR|nr:PREDICTED: uncharacterized protein LOC109382941 isoform X2 [Hipposideros armiger]
MGSAVQSLPPCLVAEPRGGPDFRCSLFVTESQRTGQDGRNQLTPTWTMSSGKPLEPACRKPSRIIQLFWELHPLDKCTMGPRSGSHYHHQHQSSPITSILIIKEGCDSSDPNSQNSQGHLRNRDSQSFRKSGRQPRLPSTIRCGLNGANLSAWRSQGQCSHHVLCTQPSGRALTTSSTYAALLKAPGLSAHQCGRAAPQHTNSPPQDLCTCCALCGGLSSSPFGVNSPLQGAALYPPPPHHASVCAHPSTHQHHHHHRSCACLSLLGVGTSCVSLAVVSSAPGLAHSSERVCRNGGPPKVVGHLCS